MRPSASSIAEKVERRVHERVGRMRAVSWFSVSAEDRGNAREASRA
jgi:hypothetical protein